MARVLVACESSGTVRDAFRAAGHKAWSCDLLPAEGPHIQGDALEAIFSKNWDLVIGHPPCTHLTSSGSRWWKRKHRDGRQQAGISFFLHMILACIEIDCRWAIENPIGIMSRVYRKPDQIIQPYQFGHNASKATCLWLHDLPLLRPTRFVAPRMVKGRPRWANQTDSGQNRLPPSDDRGALRSRTYKGVARAMATQWGEVL
jgi:hypothetical protein